MISLLDRLLLVAATALVASCGGGGSPSTVVAPHLTSTALAPLKVTLAAGAAQQLTVTGTFSDGTTAILSAADEIFTSSNTNIAAVSAAGEVTVAPGASQGETATITVEDTATGIRTASGSSTVVTVATPTGGVPTSNSGTAVRSTAAHNGLCTAVAPFYWEMGDKSGLLDSDSLSGPAGFAYDANTVVSIASASKLVYAAYVVQIRAGAANLTSSDIDFLHFTSGHTYMGDTGACPATLNPDTVNSCLTLTDLLGNLFSAVNPAAVGRFYYDSAHMENHASKYTALGDVPLASLGPTVAAKLGTDVSFSYSEPLMAGGIKTSASMYALILRHILDGSLGMHDALGTGAVCTSTASPCNAGYTPFPAEAWHYSIGHWVEDDPSTHGDGAFSSAGAFGFYPWIDSTRTYYGIVAREQNNGAYASAQCGRLLRRAWISGVEQTGAIPTD